MSKPVSSLKVWLLLDVKKNVNVKVLKLQALSLFIPVSHSPWATKSADAAFTTNSHSLVFCFPSFTRTKQIWTIDHCAPLPRSQDDSAFPWKTQPLEKSEAFPWAIQTVFRLLHWGPNRGHSSGLGDGPKPPRDFPENPLVNGNIRGFNVFANSSTKKMSQSLNQKFPQQKNAKSLDEEPSFRFFHGGEADSWHPYRRCRAEVWCFGAICLEKHGNFTNKSSPSSCLIKIVPI